MSEPKPILLTGWTAKRAGAGMTIHGVNAGTEEPLKVTGVVEIKHRPANLPIATTKDGAKYELA